MDYLTLHPPRLYALPFFRSLLEELKRFCQAIVDHPLRAAFLTTICTGLRRSELVGATIDALDLEAGTLRVIKTRQIVPGTGAVEGAPKTRRSRRSVEIGPALVSVLRAELGRRVLSGIKSEYVFCTDNGQPLKPDVVSRSFQKSRIAAGVPYMRFQDLRHLHASLMLGTGGHMKALSERLGHSSIATTFDIYAHLMPGVGRAAAEVVERQVFGSEG